MAKRVTPEPANDNLKQTLQSNAENIKAIAIIENILSNSLDVGVSVSPEEMIDLMEMYITLMYLKRVTTEYWIDHISLPVQGIALAKGIVAEGALLTLPTLPETVRETVKGAMQLSGREISNVRKRMIDKIGELKQIPVPGTVLS